MFDAKVICDSLAPCKARLTAIQATYPRIIHDELLTHRRLSRNSTSSRAKPTSVLLEEVRTYPYVPTHWGLNQRGMQARQEAEGEVKARSLAEWLDARDDALRHAEKLHSLGLHKQVINYILMPFSWITVVISATHWSNLFALRVHPDAHPAFQHVAGLMFAAYNASEPRVLMTGDWHLPYVSDEEASSHSLVDCKGMATARCARVSVKPFSSDRANIPDDLRLYADLQKGAGDGIGHWSPFEHSAMALAERRWSGNFLGFMQHRKEFPNEEIAGRVKDSTGLDESSGPLGIPKRPFGPPSLLPGPLYE